MTDPTEPAPAATPMEAPRALSGTEVMAAADGKGVIRLRQVAAAPEPTQREGAPFSARGDGRDPLRPHPPRHRRRAGFPADPSARNLREGQTTMTTTGDRKILTPRELTAADLRAAAGGRGIFIICVEHKGQDICRAA